MIHGLRIERVRVAVSQRVDVIAARDEQRDALDRRLVQWLEQVGTLTFPVPNGLIAVDALLAWLDVLVPQCVLLSGGNDIGDSPERDSTELALLRYADEKNLPVLGICRGMQMLAHHAGAALVPISGHSCTVHAILPEVEDRLPAKVDSFHDWALATCPHEYRVLARAPDGSIEAIRHLSRNWEGWMWHPEREQVFDESLVARARRLFHGSQHR